MSSKVVASLNNPDAAGGKNRANVSSRPGNTPSAANGATTAPTVVVSVPSEDQATIATDLITAHCAVSTGTKVVNANDIANVKEEEFDDDFDDLELGPTDQVPLGEILERLQEAAALACATSNSEIEGDGGSDGDFIRLHAAAADQDDGSPTISATVNVATLDLSDPESIHAHLSQLNDTVLKVSLNDDPSLSIASPAAASSESPLSPKLDSSCSSSSSSGYLSSPPLSSSQLPPVQSSSPSSSSSSPPSTAAKPPSLPIGPLSHSTNNPSSSVAKTATRSASTPSVSTGGRRSSSSTSKSSPQVCSICTKSFSNASALAKHRLTHSEERRYQCNTCSKAFKRQDHLNGHLLTHRSTKPFACLVEGCGKSYCDARSLRRHKENHHGSKAAKDASSLSVSVPSTTSVTIVKSKVDDPNSKSIDNQSTTKLKSQGLVVSTKGLSPQQVQLIEQLFKDSKSITTTDTTRAGSSRKSSRTASPVKTASSPAGSITTVTAKKTDASIAASNIAAKALAAVQNQAFQLTTLDVSPCSPESGNATGNAIVLAEKPVECTLCSKKFKNIPALNGHMRLHGGYYKRDAEGKRIVNAVRPSNDDPPPAPSPGHLRPLLEESKKRKLEQEELSIQTSSLTQDLITHILHSPQTMNNENKVFTSLPQPNTNQLLANLERSASTPGPQEISPSPMLSSPPADHQAPGIRLPSIPATPIAIKSAPFPASKSSSSSSSFYPAQVTLSISSETSQITETTSSASPAVAAVKIPLANVMKVDVASDKTPKIGEEHQADIPDMMNPDEVDENKDSVVREEMLWDPKIGSKISQQALQSYLTLASSCLVPGVARKEESALRALYKSGGNVQAALLQLMSNKNKNDDGLKTNAAWSDEEVSAFYESLVKYHKDFDKIAENVGSRSKAECVEYYYIWKNVCRDESRSFKAIFSASIPNNNTLDQIQLQQS